MDYIITSKDNTRIKELRKLLKKKYRDKSGTFLIEGFHLLEEAVKSGAEIRQVFVEEGKENRVRNLSNWFSVRSEVLKSLSETESPQGVVAEVVKGQSKVKLGGKILILENVQDPGNVGTLIRTADAAGFDGVVCFGKTADIYSPKVLRATQGSNFHIPVEIDKEADFSKFTNLLVSTLSKDSIDYREVHLEEFALVVGNEGQGVSDAAVSAASQLIHIPIPGHAESLNVAVAAGILMFSL
ncbi:TrmH family RNA methyltransferase [Lactovum miscens]|uniref:TrmH family RNA methyltransferase n=1 Tax=Lactovum miscens TaxID=190387 RepID=A0A841C913_9LACT|nr:RNA methyltransferase [Lactovum miscens]MBB5888797.1 TrmH family RNA methyltransferase [Lactovum miscens]